LWKESVQLNNLTAQFVQKKLMQERLVTADIKEGREIWQLKPVVKVVL